jgi:hypothetical protein
VKPSPSLIAEWERRLKDAGFNDIEQTDKSGERVLKQNAANGFNRYGQQEVVNRQAVTTYYELMSEAIHQHWFESDSDEVLITRVAAGEKLGAIADDIGIHRQTARHIVRRFENRYLIRKWNLKQMNLTNPDDSYSIVRFEGDQLPEQYSNMVLSQFLRSLRNGNDYFKLMDSKAYYKTYGAYVESLLARPNMTIAIAALSSDKDVVLAWSLSEPGKLHYVFCKPDYRRNGIATSILPKNIEILTHLTTLGTSMWSSKYPHAKFNPFT